MVYFISGHRDLTQEEFDTHYAPLIDEIMRNDVFTEFVVGDMLFERITPERVEELKLKYGSSK